MDKIFPIKLDKAGVLKYKTVQWKLHNKCNYNCSFCSANNKDGSDPWFSIEKYKSVIDKLYKSNDSPIYFIFTGGEPTLYPNFIELLQYTKSLGGTNILITNGSRTIRWWKELVEANCLDRLTLTYHSEQSKDYQHVTEVINLFHDVPTETYCEVTHTKDTIDLAFEGCNYLIKNTGGVIHIKSMNIHAYNIHDMYTEEQLAFIKKHNYRPGEKRHKVVRKGIPLKSIFNAMITMTYNNGDRKIMDHQTLLKNQANSFTEWQCEVGQNELFIDHAKIYRGVCEVGGSIGSIDDEVISFSTDNVICTKKHCECFSDIAANKIKL